jgi:polyhydroxybutyrate depolymerase
MEWRIFIVLAAAALLCGCLAAETKSGNSTSVTNNYYYPSHEPSTTPPANTSMGPGTYSEGMDYGGYQRTFIVHVPPSYDGSKPYPLVFVLHGLGGSAQGMVNITRFSEKADSEGFIVAYLQGLGGWNAGGCCGYSRENNIDDVGFVSAMMDNLEARLKVNESRIYATGFSNGGMMSYLLGCRLSDRIAAIAPVSGALTVDDCSPSRPVPLITFHGTTDAGVPYEGGVSSNPANPEGPPVFKPVLSEISFWAALDGCDENSTKTVTKDVTLQSYAGCADGTEVLLYTIKNGTHSWPGTSMLPPGSTDREVSATDLIWQFFEAHPKG